MYFHLWSHEHEKIFKRNKLYMALASAIKIKEFYKEIYLCNPIFTCTFMVIIRRPPLFDRDWWVCDSSVDGVFQLTCRCLSETLFGVGGGADEFRFLFNELVDWSVSWASFCCRWSCCLVFDSTDSCRFMEPIERRTKKGILRQAMYIKKF